MGWNLNLLAAGLYYFWNELIFDLTFPSQGQKKNQNGL